jgi:hypothetical protein
MEGYPQYPQAATNIVPSQDQSQVAPTQEQQVYETVPGSQQVDGNYQPVVPNPAVEQAAPQVDYEARFRAEETARLAAEQRAQQIEQQNQQFNQVFQQIQQHTEQQRIEEESRQRIQAIVARAESMAPGEASTYMREQMLQVQRQEQQARDVAIQQTRQQAQQAIKMAAMPQYADHVVETMKLPPEAKQELLSLGDPDLMFRQAPVIKQRYEQMEQLRQQIQQSSQQSLRAGEVNAMRQNGLTNIGGQAASGFNMENLPSDPTERAMAIYEQIDARRRGVFQ